LTRRGVVAATAPSVLLAEIAFDAERGRGRGDGGDAGGVATMIGILGIRGRRGPSSLPPRLPPSEILPPVPPGLPTRRLPPFGVAEGAGAGALGKDARASRALGTEPAGVGRGAQRHARREGGERQQHAPQRTGLMNRGFVRAHGLPSYSKLPARSDLI